ncbi:MAG: LicD family protein [Muribaculaceae bacterium]|nr:LicD family protein [Muribaculaceae bacterium]
MTHLQSVLLMILSDVDKLLKENNIAYFLDGGSALGAVRHKGFIPWDDDLDIVILPEDYERFVEVCRTKLDKEKYTFQEAEKDWPLPFSKIKLNGTSIEEVDEFQTENKGIYIDIFCMDNAKKSNLAKYRQVIFGRIYTACFLSEKGYTANTIPKKIALSLAKGIRKSKSLFKLIRDQVRPAKSTNQLSLTWDRTRKHWKDYFVDRDLFKYPIMMEFEGKQFPVCNGYDTYLTKLYGDYMQLPPEDKRVPLHIKSIDFGKY